MRKPIPRITLLLLLFTSLFVSVTLVAPQQVEQELRGDFLEAFHAVEDAELRGGDVASLVVELNEILELIEIGGEAELLEAATRIEAVKGDAIALGMVGEEGAQAQLVESALILLAASVLSLLVWRFAPRLIWRYWLRSKGEWKAYP